MQNFDVIINGGGPTGVALAIELGMQGVKTLVLEKHASPLLSPRAQSLNARSMEFFRRWHLSEALKSRRLLPDDWPIQGVWCSKLNGETFAVSSSNDQLDDTVSPELGVRMPLWITEDVLRSRLASLPSVTFLKEYAVVDVDLDTLVVTAKHHDELKQFHAQYIIACDGAKSITRTKCRIAFDELAPVRRVISVVFSSKQLAKMITVEKGFLYYLLSGNAPGALGPLDPIKGLWYAQVGDTSQASSIDEIDLHKILVDLTGFEFDVEIMQANFWDMHIQIAREFSKNNRVFLVGDSAHGFVPTGGYGLNTGFGDVTNLGWKLAAVIKGAVKPGLLETYEQERRPVCLQNLAAAQKNANDMMTVRKQIDPSIDPVGFSKANAELALQHTHSLGNTAGYAYFHSQLTLLGDKQDTEPMQSSQYRRTVAAGYYLPHIRLEGKSIYDVLSPTDWTLLISDDVAKETISEFKNHFTQRGIQLQTLTIPKELYQVNVILIRPDWHIAWVSDSLNEDYFARLG